MKDAQDHTPQSKHKDTADFSNSEQKRNDAFIQKPITQIWEDIPSEENPYVPQTAFCQGYEYSELIKSVSFIQLLYLLLKGELPSKAQVQLLEKWFVTSVNSGPRHPAARAGMNAAIGKTNVVHILPVIMGIFGGDHLGAGEVKPSMRFIREHILEDPQIKAQEVLQSLTNNTAESGDIHIVPGFGTRFGSIDILNREAGNYLAGLEGAGKALKWCHAFAEELAQYGMSWLDPGIAAAISLDLDFDEFTATCLFQLVKGAGVFPYALEKLGKPLTDMPFPDDKSYFIE